MFFIFFLAILFSGLAVLTGLILAIVGLSSNKSKMRNVGFIVLGVGVVFLLCSIYFSVTRVVAKVKNTTMGAFSMIEDSLNAYKSQNQSLLEDNRLYLLDDTCSNPKMKMIKTASEKNGKGFNNTFYTYFGDGVISRMPLIYPYAMHCWDSKNLGTLVSEENVIDVKNQPEGEQNIAFNISAINYDERVILMRVSTTDAVTNKEVYSYLTYSIENKESVEYKTEEAMYKAASKLGYTGDKQLISLWDYDAQF
jgi:hypothetical protein